MHIDLSVFCEDLREKDVIYTTQTEHEVCWGEGVNGERAGEGDCLLGGEGGGEKLHVKFWSGCLLLLLAEMMCVCRR